jgi:hypothetical protein
MRLGIICCARSIALLSSMGFAHGGEVEFVASAARTAQPQMVELEDALKMREQHLDLLPLVRKLAKLIPSLQAIPAM